MKLKSKILSSNASDSLLFFIVKIYERIFSFLSVHQSVSELIKSPTLFAENCYYL